MKHLLKGITAVAIVMVVLMMINVFCNMNGISLNSTMTGSIGAICAVAIYHCLIKNEKK